MAKLYKILSTKFIFITIFTLFFTVKSFSHDKTQPLLKQTWIKETYLIDLSNFYSKELIYTAPLKVKTRISCQVLSPENQIIIKSACKKIKDKYYLIFNKNKINTLNQYFKQNPPLDKFFLPNFVLKIKINSRSFKTKIYFYVKNYKPIIYTSALIKDNRDMNNICIFVVKDKHDLYLTSEFFIHGIDKNPNKIISVFSNNQEDTLDVIPKKLLAKLQKKRIKIIFYKFKSQQTSCKLILSNGITIESGENSAFISTEEFIHNLEIITNTDIK